MRGKWPDRPIGRSSRPGVIECMIREQNELMIFARSLFVLSSR